MFIQRRHRLGSDRSFTVELPHQELSSNKLEVTVIGGRVDQDVLWAYLEGPASGGGQEKEVEFIKCVGNGVYHVQVSSTQGKHCLGGGLHVLLKKK